MKRKKKLSADEELMIALIKNEIRKHELLKKLIRKNEKNKS